MLKVLGISLGSSDRDFSHEFCVSNKKIKVSRKGTDGSLKRAVQLVKKFDGQVEVIALGGVNKDYFLGERKYPIREGQLLARTARVTPVVDGAVIKAFLETETINYLTVNDIVRFEGKTVLFVSVLDRYPLAKAFEKLGAKLVIGDAMFALGIPLPFYNLSTFEVVGKLMLPFLKHLPLSYLYPLGRKQIKNKPRFGDFFEKADIIAGDYHFIGRNMPENLSNKIIITSTVTEENIDELKIRGAKLLITTSPLFNGRTYGGNILEGLFWVLRQNCQVPLKQEEIKDIAAKIDWQPTVLNLG